MLLHISPAACGRGAVLLRKSPLLVVPGNVHSGGRSFGLIPFVWAGMVSEVDEMVFFTPSRNTDQGV